MGKVKVLLAILSISYHVLKMTAILLAIWLTLGWNVRRARKAFEAELRKEGVSKEDAEKLSEYYSILKNQMVNAAKSSIRSGTKGRTP